MTRKQSQDPKGPIYTRQCIKVKMLNFCSVSRVFAFVTTLFQKLLPRWSFRGKDDFSNQTSACISNVCVHDGGARSRRNGNFLKTLRLCLCGNEGKFS